MTGEKILNPSYYDLKSLTIQSVVGSVSEELGSSTLDITNLVPEIVINTSIDSDVLSGSIRVIDGVGVLEKFPLRGEERVSIVLEDSMENEITLDVMCYQISSMSVSDENGVVAYTMSFVSYQSFWAGKHRIIKAYREEVVSDIVSELFEAYYRPLRESRPSDFGANPGETVNENSNKDIIIYPLTEGSIRCTIPNMKPGEAINFLSKRSFSSGSPSCSFRFFENLRSYYFMTDEMMFDVAETRNKRFNFTYYDSIPRTPDYFEEYMNNLDSFVNSRRVNSIEDMYGGAYRNKVITLDIIHARANLLDEGYSYLDNRGSYFDVMNEQVKDRHTEEFINEFANEEVQKTFIVVKDYMDTGGNQDNALQGMTFFPDIISNRIAYRKHLNSINIQAVGPGRFDISAGDVVNMLIPELNAEKETIDTNKQLSGDYIVKSVTYHMENEIMKNHYILVKKEWSEVTDITDDNNSENDIFGGSNLNNG